MTRRQRFAGMFYIVAACTTVTSIGTAQQPLQVANQPEAQILQQPISLDVHDAPLEDVLRTIRRQVDDQLMFDGAVVDQREPRVTYQARNLPLGTVLRDILQGRDIVILVERKGEAVLLKRRRTIASSSTNGIVAGRVTDSTTGAGLAGATVRIDGSKLNTISSDSGYFQLKNIPTGDQVISVRLFGYRPVNRSITVVDSQRTMVRIVMSSVPTVLSGVVTTATGQQRKIEVGSDITTINVDSVMRVAPIQTMTDLLETRVPGLTVVHSSGAPGDPSRIRIRGTGSIQLNNDPIIIIDGVRTYSNQSDPRNQNLAPTKSAYQFNAPSPLDQIDPSNIETIEVLKGPSATATYGSDAANGVIVVTTKHGRSGPTHWDLGLGAGVNWLPGTWPMNYYRFGSNASSIGAESEPFCNWNNVYCSTDSIVPFQALNDPRYTVFTHGSDQQATLTISGGSQTLTYSLTGSGAGDLGNLKLPESEQARYDSLYGKISNALVRPDRYTTWGVSGVLTAIVSPKLRVTLQSSLFNGTQQHSSLEEAINQLQGEYISPIYGTYSPGRSSTAPGLPLLSQEYERATDDQLTSTNTLSSHWQPFAWLPIDATGGINTIQRTDVSYVPFGIYDGDFLSGGIPETSDTTGFYGLGRGTSHDQTVTLGTAIPVAHNRATVAIGGNLHSGTTADIMVSTNQLSPGVSVPTTFTTDGTLINSPTTQSTSSQSTYGWYVEPRLNFASKFFVSPGFRLDGGSGAATSAGSVGGLSGFPKIDLSYVAVDRQAKAPLWGVISLLRPRLAFGFAGTQPSPADKLRLYNVGNYTITEPGQGNLTTGSNPDCAPTISLDGTTMVSAVCLNALGNTQLRPERSSELEGGFDATLWQGRLSITYTQYNKTRHDAILDIPVAQSIGSGDVTSIEKNIGVIRNTGTEITVTGAVLQSRAIGWTVGMNVSNDNNLVVSLNKGQNPIIIGAGTGLESRVQAGYPLFGTFTRPIIGFADANHNGVIDPDEIQYGDSVVYIGQPNPKYQANFTSDLTLLNGRLSVHAGFAYQKGMTQINAGACNGSGAFALLPNNPKSTLATQAAVVAAGCELLGPDQINNGSSEIGATQVVNTFRFQDFSINYNVPKRVAVWVHVPRMTVAVQGSNLGLHTNYRGFDPNVNAFSTVTNGDATQDNGQVPQPRTWWLRLTLGN